jgi:hypothetical protein
MSGNGMAGGFYSAKRKPAGTSDWLLEFVIFKVFRFCVKPSF